ncbi:hypothetical protein D3C71_1714760 [compost metagenome]
MARQRASRRDRQTRAAVRHVQRQGIALGARKDPHPCTGRRCLDRVQDQVQQNLADSASGQGQGLVVEHALAIELHAYACLAGLSIHHQADVGDIFLAQPRVAGAKGT